MARLRFCGALVAAALLGSISASAVTLVEPPSQAAPHQQSQAEHNGRHSVNAPAGGSTSLLDISAWLVVVAGFGAVGTLVRRRGTSRSVSS